MTIQHYLPSGKACANNLPGAEVRAVTPYETEIPTGSRLQLHLLFREQQNFKILCPSFRCSPVCVQFPSLGAMVTIIPHKGYASSRLTRCPVCHPTQMISAQFHDCPTCFCDPYSQLPGRICIVGLHLLTIFTFLVASYISLVRL